MPDQPYIVKLKPHQAPRISSLLGHLDIELTERCNNACIHCFINQPENDAHTRAREMDTACVKTVLQQAADLGCLSVRFTGGEPLLRADFTELYLYARRLGMRVKLFTNARLVTLELAKIFARIPPGQEIEVTVYGMHAESYDAVSASRGAFAEFWQGIEWLRAYNIPFIVKQSILPPNHAEMSEFEAFTTTLPYMDKRPSYTMNFDLRARRDNPAKNRVIESLRLTPQETVGMLARNPNYVREMKEFAGKFMRPPGDKLFSCGAGHGTCIDAYGKAQMCLELRHPDTVYDLCSDNGGLAPNGCAGSDDVTSTGGNIPRSPLRNALTEFFPRLREIRATNPDYLNRCARCFLKSLCEQCPAKSWMEHGTLDTPVEYLCHVAHANARYLGLLQKRENAWDVTDWQQRVTQFASMNNG